MVDDGSCDGSSDLLRHLSNVFGPRIVDLTTEGEGNKGAHYRLNQLIETARSEWIAVLNSDDEFVSGRFDMIKALVRANRSDFISGSLLICDEHDRLIGTKRGIVDPEYPIPQRPDRDRRAFFAREMLVLLCNQNFIATTSNMAFRKSLFRQVGGFRDYRYVHDWDFALRACVTGRCLFTYNPLTIYRAHCANTIKEPSSHVDGEVVRLFARFLNDFPELERDEQIREALESNRHLGRYCPPVNTNGQYSRIIAVDSTPSGGPSAVSIQHSAGKDQLVHLAAMERPLPVRALNNAALALVAAPYDFMLVSETLDEPPIVALSSLSDNVLMNERARQFFLEGKTPQIPMRGRIIRNVPQLDARTRIVELTSLTGFQNARLEGATVTIPGLTDGSGCARVSQCEVTLRMPMRSGEKPLCFVLPIFLAVGGVERNMVEVLRILRADYDFVIVTSERLAKHQGSLHHQLDDLQIPVLDLGEAAEPARHLLIIDLLRRHFRPDLVWICNGSPWLADNADRIRRVFANIPIVDQQVYDTEHGWINRYRERGIQSFDRFIATTRKIMNKFVSDIGIPANRIDLIYSSIDSQKLALKKGDQELERSLRQDAGMPLDARIYAFIGRLTAQKRPLEYLGLAKRAANHGLRDQFLIVGDGELRAACEAYIEREELRNVRMIRYCEDLSTIVNMMDGLIITSEFEGLPIALLEVLALGKPAMATNVGDIDVILSEHGSGLIAPLDGGSEALWEVFQQWRTDLRAYRQNAEAHAADIRERFSNVNIAAQYRASWMAAIKHVRGERVG